MIRHSKFWVSMAAFQLLFGFAVFAITRALYMQPAESVSAPAPAVSQPAPGLGVGDITEMARARLTHSSSSEPISQDPAELTRQAAQAFSSQQYDRAADLYARLLATNPRDVDVLNELGLTLHYIGRSAEALRRLNEGVALDPTHQRIRLTLGYVNSQLGNTKEARAALTAASQIGSDQAIRQSALSMLQNLPK